LHVDVSGSIGNRQRFAVDAEIGAFDIVVGGDRGAAVVGKRLVNPDCSVVR
jgi:hypothetical protein